MRDADICRWNKLECHGEEDKKKKGDKAKAPS